MNGSDAVRHPPGGAAATPAAVPDGARVAVERLRPGTTVVRLSGEIDLATADAVARTLLDVVAASHGHRILVELDEVRFLGACGLEVLRAAAERAAHLDAELRVVLDDAAPAARTLRLAPDLVFPAARTPGLPTALEGGRP
jgi:anti-anti-sigma factor